MITAAVRYLTDVNALHLDPAAASGRAHQGIRETGEDSASIGQQGSAELVPDRGRAVAAGTENTQAGGEEAEPQGGGGPTNTQESHH